MSTNFGLQSFQPYVAPKEPTKAQSIVGAPIKGFLESGGKEVRKVGRGIEKLLGLSPEESTLIPEEEAEVRVEELFPTREGFAERALERGGGILPYTVSPQFGLSSILGSLLGGGASETIEQVGGGPLSQAVGEILGLGAPGLLQKGLGRSFSRSGQEIADIGKGLGLTEAEVTPLTQSKFKQQIIGKIAEKGKVGEALERTRKGLQRVYGELAQGGVAKQSLGENISQSIDTQISKIFEKLPTKAQTAIEPAYQRYLKSPKTGEDLIRFYGDVNELYPIQKVTGLFKNPIKKGLSSISKDLGRDFELTNHLYSKYFEIANRLKPGLENELLNAAEAGKLAYDVISGNVSGLQKTLGIITGRKLASQLLTNPRLQNLSSKFVSALNQNKPAVARQMFEKIISNVGEKNPEIAKELRKIDLSSIEEIRGDQSK